VLGAKTLDSRVSELVEWATPVQERHFQLMREGSRKLASEEDPYKTD
jgi:hypothetical protein